VIAVTDCEFVEVDDKRFNYLVQQTPFFALKVMRVLSERLRTTSAMLPIIEDV
jgi:CRP-like cAMP-binding protein